MRQVTPSRDRNLSSYRRLLESHDDDPLTSVANLFDVAMVFAVAVLFASITHFQLPKLLYEQDDVTLLKNPGEVNMEIMHLKGKELEHYQMTKQTLGGEGEKLGTAYRLKTGEVVYVPED